MMLSACSTPLKDRTIPFEKIENAREKGGGEPELGFSAAEQEKMKQKYLK